MPIFNTYDEIDGLKKEDTFLSWQASSGRVKQISKQNFRRYGVANIAALKALVVTDLDDGDSVSVRGFTSDADGGGGEFIYDSGSSASDDGGTIIQPTAGTGRWVRLYDGFVSVKWFGATGDGATDDTTAINSAIAAANHVYIPNGTYIISGQINLKSDLRISGAGGAKISLKDPIANQYMVRGNAISNVTIENLAIQGNGLQGYAAVFLSSCSNITFDNCTVTKAGTTAIFCDTCIFVKINKCDLSNNYNYGVEFRDCENCRATQNLCYLNGNTGVATSTGGRGINLWRSRDCYIAANRFVSNTEYGFRIYSEAADTTYSYGNRIIGNYFKDNTRSDFVFYDESQNGELVYGNAVSDNIAVRTTNTVIGAVYVLHGGKNTFVNNHAYKEGTFGTDVAFNFYYAMDCTMSSCSASRFAQAMSFSGCDNIVVSDFLGNEVANAATAITNDVTIKDSTFYHGGSGITDVGINLNSTPPTGRVILEGLFMDGFYVGIQVGDAKISVIRCTTVNSTGYGFQKVGSSIADQEYGMNSFDTMTNYRFGSLSKTLGANNRSVHSYPGEPNTAAISWSVGDICINDAPAVGYPKGWRCTVAGAPGTWVSEGNL